MTADLMNKISEGLKDYFLRGAPVNGKDVTANDLKRGYKQRSPISGYLPWLDIIEDDKLLLEDGSSVAAVFCGDQIA